MKKWREVVQENGGATDRDVSSYKIILEKEL